MCLGHLLGTQTTSVGSLFMPISQPFGMFLGCTYFEYHL